MEEVTFPLWHKDAPCGVWNLILIIFKMPIGHYFFHFVCQPYHGKIYAILNSFSHTFATCIMFGSFPFAANIAKFSESSTCFGNVRRGWNCHCFCPNWPESADGNSDYMLLGQNEKLVWKTSGNINPRTFLSYLCISVILFPTENYLYHSEFPSTEEHDFEIPWFSGNLSERKRRWNGSVIKQTLLLCSILRFEKAGILSLLQANLFPLTCRLFYILWFVFFKFTHDQDTGWKTVVLIHWVFNTARKAMKNIPHTNRYMSLHLCGWGDGRVRERGENMAELRDWLSKAEHEWRLSFSPVFINFGFYLNWRNSHQFIHSLTTQFVSLW